MTSSTAQGTNKKKPSKKNEAGENERRVIALNRRARHEYFIEDTFEAGLVLAGWEVKSLRDGRAQVTEAYVVIKNREAFLVGAHFTPLKQASTHVNPEPTRTRKLLLHERQLAQLIGKVERAGYTIVPLDLHWTRGRAKLQIGLAKGKKQHDKRDDVKQRDWEREKGRLLRARG
jgi:SsrA-binding protein